MQVVTKGRWVRRDEQATADELEKAGLGNSTLSAADATRVQATK
jgi:hypothetical protein